MDDEPQPTSTVDGRRQRARRRAVLAAVGAGLGTAVAGCLGGGGSGTATPAGGADGDGTSQTGASEQVTAAPEALAAPRRGAADAPVTVAVYVDFACPHCRSFHEDVVPRLDAEYVEAGVVAYEHRDFPLPVDDPESYRAANAARAVQATEGAAAFFEYTDLLFENQRDLGPSLYESLAGDVGADPATVRRAATERAYRRTVDRDVTRGREAGVSSTPTVFVDGDVFEGRTWGDLTDRIERARPEPS